jgi:transcriptional regulator with XRE-family HTH domain
VSGAGVDLRALRLNRGLSIRAAAREMGIEHMVLQRAEARTTTPRPAHALKIASFYGLQVTDVWPLDSEVPAA